MTTFLLIGGIFNTAFAIFHLFFWKLFNWKQDLSSLTALNRNVMQVLNLCLTFVFLVFAYISFFHAEELLQNGLGNSLLIAVAVFWFLRAIYQILFFGIKHVVSIVFFLIFLFGTAVYAIPLFL